MSRNKEKSQSALHRYEALKAEQAGVLQSNPNLRPKSVQTVQSLPQAEKWRSTLVTEILVKLTRINDPELNNYQIRELNDQINRHFREKRAWEYHIKSLGGADYISFKGDVSGATGIEVNGQRYYGRAKELPDVKKILEAQRKHKEDVETKKSKEAKQDQILKQRQARIGVEYYGLLDAEPDTISTDFASLIDDVNASIGKEVLTPVSISYKEKKRSIKNSTDELLKYERKVSRKIRDKEGNHPDNIVDFETVVPSNEEVSKWVVEQRKKKLLERIAASS